MAIPELINLQPFVAGNAACRSIVVLADLCGARLSLTYLIKGDMAQLRVPPPSTPRWADHLWERTCLEAFVGMASGPAYYEFNFSPSTEWAMFEFTSYRDGKALDRSELAPKICIRRGAEELELVVEVGLSQLALIEGETKLRIGLSAVVESIEGNRSYWALTHPSDKPDFHHADSFTLELALPLESA